MKYHVLEACKTKIKRAVKTTDPKDLEIINTHLILEGVDIREINLPYKMTSLNIEIIQF